MSGPAATRARRAANAARQRRDDIMEALGVYAELASELGAMFAPAIPLRAPAPQEATDAAAIPDAEHLKGGEAWTEVSPGVFTKASR